ncbi:MAG: hypothetical protein Q8L29_03745 [archaeon]|nr:hypothetical protein [archaeon]
MENPKITTEFKWNRYPENTGCPSLRTILAYQDNSVTNNVVPQILTLADAERVERSYGTVTLTDEKTGKTIVLGPSFFPANLFFELHFKYYGVPNRPMPSKVSVVTKVPQTPKEFFQVYREMKEEGIDVILRCPGKMSDIDMAFNMARGENSLKDSLEEIMCSPNKPILIDLIHENQSEKFRQTIIERCKKKIDENTFENPQILAGDLKLYDEKGYPILESSRHKNTHYEHSMFKIEMPKKPHLLRYLIPFNETNLGNLQQLLAEKLITYISRMHSQVPAIKQAMEEQKDNEDENERIKRNTILQARKEAEEDKERLKEIGAMSKAREKNPNKFSFPIMF